MPPTTTFDPEVVKRNQALVSPTINTSTLASSGDSLDLPPFNVQSADEIRASGQAALRATEGEIARLQGQRTQTESQQESLVGEFLSTLRQSQGRDEAQFSAEQQAGIPEQEKRLQELSGRINQLESEALAIPLQIQEEFTGRGVTAGGVEPIQKARLRQNAIQSLTLGAQAQALQGNIALARQQVNRAVDLEFKPIEDRLEFLKTAYSLNKDILDREDKKRSEQLQIQLDERERLLNDKKENKKAIGSLIVEASKNVGNPPPQEVIDEALASGDLDTALSLLSSYLADPLDAQAKLADIQNTQASTALSIANRRKVESEIKQQTDATKGVQSEILENYSIVDSILNADDSVLDRLTGVSGLVPIRPGSDAIQTDNQIKQLLGILKLENRQKLKGQGQISDFEGKILADASTSLSKTLSKEDFKFQLAQIRGAFANSAGLEAPVKITAPDGATKFGAASRALIDEAIASGYKVEYTQ